MQRILLCTIAFVPSEFSQKTYIVHDDTSNIEQVDTKEALLNAFIYVESKGSDSTVNKKSGATGCLQIMPILIDEANRLTGTGKYTLSDRTDRNKSREIFHLIMERKNPSYDIDIACKVWNPNGKQSYTDSVRNKFNELINKRQN